MWTSLRMESYMTVTAHFIDENWKAKSLLLERGKKGEADTGRNIAADYMNLPMPQRSSRKKSVCCSEQRG